MKETLRKKDEGLLEDLKGKFTEAGEMLVDELDFFLELLEDGFTLEDVKTAAPEYYEYSKKFCEEHGLVSTTR